MNYIKPIKKSKASGVVKEVYADIKSIFPGPIAEPYSMHSLDSASLLAYWNLNKEVYLSGNFKREYKDIIAAGVSDTNQCPYCFEPHTELLKFTSKEITKGFRSRELQVISDPHLRELAEWSRNTVNPALEIVKNPPFGRKEKAEIVGVALMFHYTNRIANIFFDDSPLPIPNIPGLKRLVMVMASPMMKKVAHLKVPIAHDSAAPDLPADMGWAQGNGVVAKSFLRFFDAAEKAGKEIPASVKELLTNRLSDWHGETVKTDKVAMEYYLRIVPEKYKAIGELAILTAFSSYKVTDSLMKEVRKYGTSDTNLSKLVIWSAAQATRRIGSWL